MEGDVSGGGCGRTTADVEVEPQDYHRVFEVFYEHMPWLVRQDRIARIRSGLSGSDKLSLP